jgi:ASC-1-like (ASCH) protein
MYTYKKNISEPWFSLIQFKLKTVDVRINHGDFSIMEIGDILVFTNKEFGWEREITVEITKITEYDTFDRCLQYESTDQCLPGIDSIREGLTVYYHYFTKTEEEDYGVKAYRFEILEI